MNKIKKVIELIVNEEMLPASLKNHSLKGNWSGCFDLHIEPDWILIYRLLGGKVRFERTGTHSDLFR